MLIERVRRARVDLGALIVAPLSLGLVLLAQSIAAAPMRTLLQLDAALIVFGGTAGALVVSFSVRELLSTLRAIRSAFTPARQDFDDVGTLVVRLAARAHRRGLMSIEQEVEALREPFLQDGLMFALDEPSLEAVRDVLHVQAEARTDVEEAPARLLETAARYASTCGVLGAVLGLVEVMQRAAPAATLGDDIAVAFVAAAYGLGAAGLVCVPLAGRLRARAALERRRREALIHGICSIHQRMHPRAVAQKLRAYGVNAAVPETREPRVVYFENGRLISA